MDTISLHQLYKRMNKGKGPEAGQNDTPLSSTQEKKAFEWDAESATLPGTEHLCHRHYSLNYQAHAAPRKLREGNCMCCYMHRAHTPEFFTVSNGIIDKTMSPLLLPSTTAHATGVICQKHYMRNVELYEIYKKSHSLRLECGAFMRSKGEIGEDAYFVGENGRFLGLADGVGGWAQYGIDPRLFPERLMEEVHKVLQEGRQSDVVDIICTAFENSKQITGSSTVVMAMLDKSDTLRTFNLGDSGFRVIRDFQILYASREQQHAPNKPYQIGTGCEDAPEKGTVEHMKLKAGDMLVFASDGLFDNLFDSEIIDLIRNTDYRGDMDQLANHIAHAAYLVSIDKHAQSPYAAWIRSLGNPDWTEVLGGKKDDITVIVARVVQRTFPTHEASLHHFQNTTMSLSIDSPSLASLLSQVKWDSPALSSALSLSSPALPPPSLPSFALSRSSSALPPSSPPPSCSLSLSSSALPAPMRSSSERNESIARSAPIEHALRTEGQEVSGGRSGEEARDEKWGTIRNRSTSASGYFPDPKLTNAPLNLARQDSQKPQNKNTGVKSNSHINSWADVLAARGGFLRHRGANSTTVRELAQSNLLNQVTEQPNATPDANALRNSTSLTSSSSADETTVMRSISLPVRRASHDASLSIHGQSSPTTPPSPTMQLSLTMPPSPTTPPSPLSLSIPSPRSPLGFSSCTVLPYLTPLASPPTPRSLPHTPRSPLASSSPRAFDNAVNTSPRMAVARRLLAPRDNYLRATSSVLPCLDTELVAGRPTLRENCTEQDYFEYMIATREFEVFVNLHRHTRITILPYFI